MTTFQEMLKKRPVDPQVLEAKVQKMQEETRAYQEAQDALYAQAAPEFNKEAQARKTARRRRPSPSHEEP